MTEISNTADNNNKPLLKGWIRAFLIIVPFFIFEGIFHLIGSHLLMRYSPIDPLIEMTVLQGFGLVGTLLPVFIFTRYLDRTSFKSLGFQLKGYIDSIFAGVATGALVMALGFAILFFGLNEICVTKMDFDVAKLLTSIVFFVLVALSEEIFLRGYILNNFMQSMNRYLALAVSSLIFSLLHFFNPSFSWIGFVGIFLAGLLLGISYIYTKNLWFPIALHFSWNFFQGTIFGFNVSGQSTYSLINQHPVGNNILNGGEFGFEGSILSHVFIVISILLIWRLTRK